MSLLFLLIFVSLLLSLCEVEITDVDDTASYGFIVSEMDFEDASGSATWLTSISSSDSSDDDPYPASNSNSPVDSFPFGSTSVAVVVVGSGVGLLLLVVVVVVVVEVPSSFGIVRGKRRFRSAIHRWMSSGRFPTHILNFCTRQPGMATVTVLKPEPANFPCTAW